MCRKWFSFIQFVGIIRPHGSVDYHYPCTHNHLEFHLCCHRTALVDNIRAISLTKLFCILFAEFR